jgi:uncharacterized protein involved in outer membrane biogenesis
MSRVGDWLRGWRLLSWRSAVVAAFVLYTLAGFLLAPLLVKKVAVDSIAAATGRNATLESVRINPFTLSLTARGFRLPDRQGTALVSFDELHVNLQASSLFRWTLVLKEVRLRGPLVGLRRFEDGVVNVVELGEEIARRAAGAEGAAGPEDDGQKSAGLFPVLLQHILIEDARIEVEDRARPEPMDLFFGPSRLELHGISTLPDRRGDHRFAIGLRGGGTATITGEAVLEPLGLQGSVALDALDLEQVWPLLSPYFEFDLAAGRISGSFRYTVGLEADGLHAQVAELTSRIQGLDVESRLSEARVAGVEDAQVAGGRFTWPEAHFGADSVVVSSADALVWLEPDGTPSWLELVPKETRAQVATTYREVKETAAWQASLGRLEVRSATARFEDRSFDRPVTYAVEDAAVTLTDIITEPGARWGLEVAAKLPGGAPATLQGQMGIGPVFAEVEVGLEGLDLAQGQPYLERLFPLELRSGRVTTRGTAGFHLDSDGPLASFAGSVSVAGMELAETVVGSRFLAWEAVAVEGIDATVQPLALAAGEVAVQGAAVELIMAEDGRINLLELVAALTASDADEAADVEDGARVAETASMPEDAGEEVTAPAPAPAGGLPPITVAKVSLSGVSAAYTDATLEPPLTLALDDIQGEITGISSSGNTASALDITGEVRSGGRLDAEGQIDLLDPKRLTDVVLDIRQADLLPVSPLGVRYLGHGFTAGAGNVGLDYEVVESSLTGQNRIVTEGLALGPRAEGEGMLDLPVKLGVSLLTDRQGRITLEFPVEGNLDDPEFGLGGAIGGAVKSVMGQLVKSPFRLLARLGGGKADDDYAFVEFEAGRSDPGPGAVEKLATLAAGLEQRPELILEAAGAWDPDVDVPALQEAAVTDLLAGRTAGTGAAELGAETPLALLETVAGEQFGAEQVAAIRQRNLTAGGAQGGEAESSEPQAGEPVLDETTYRRDLRQALAEAQVVADAALERLGRDRAEAIRASLLAAGVAASRVSLGEPGEIKPSGSRWVRVELEVAAGD